MNKCLAAWTDRAMYPAFINVSENEVGDIVVLVRTKGADTCGLIAQIDIPREEFKKVLTDCNKEVK